MSSELVNVKWNVASNVKILVTKKNFFFKKNFNLSYMNDKYSDIKKNREDLNKFFPSTPHYTKQVHGNRVINLDNELNVSHICDGLVTRKKNQVGFPFKSLKEINAKLWVIEDDKRMCEKDKDFAEKFIKLSRDVHFLNDDRAKIKLEINNYTGSNIKEIKEYTSY